MDTDQSLDLPSLDRDPRWAENTSYENFKQSAREITLEPRVDEEVIGYFHLAKKLIALSYFDYELLDAARTRALTTYEMALRRRYRELFGPKGHPLHKQAPNECDKFHNLIGRAAQKNMLGADPGVVQAARELRNRSVHPQRNTLWGSSSMKIVYRAAMLINELYRDPEARAQRSQEMKQLNGWLNDLLSDGIALVGTRGRQLVIAGTLLHLDNEVTPPPYCFGFIEPYNKNPDPGETSRIHPVLVRATNWEGEKDGSLRLKLQREVKLVLSRDLTQSEIRAFKHWNRGKKDTWPDFHLNQMRRALEDKNHFPTPFQGSVILR